MNDLSKKYFVFYHKNCMDGLGAAWAAKQHFKEIAEYIPISYGEPFPELEYKVIYFVDFAPTKDTLIDILTKGNEVIVIDHHNTAYINLKDFYHKKFYFCYDSKKSGAVLTWEYFFNTKVPEILLYIEDRDLWKKSLPYNEQVSAALFQIDFEIDALDKIIQKDSVDELITEGKILLKYREKLVKEVSKSCMRLIDFEGYKVPFINANGFLASDIGDYVNKDYPFCMTYFDTSSSRVISLRSREIDVSLIASWHGGGGHMKAAGFKVDRDHWLAKI